MGKVVSIEKIFEQRRGWKAEGKHVVFLAGRFDLLHPGHIRLLEQAREMGELVTVGVFSEECAEIPITDPNDSRTLLQRAIAPASERAEVLAALAAVDVAFEIDTKRLVHFLSRFRPELIVDGAEPSVRETPLAVAADVIGVAVSRVPLEPGHSSSRLIERITQLRA